MKRERIEKQSRKRKEREEKQLVKERRAKEAVKKETVSKRNTLSLVCQFVELQLTSDGSSSEAEDTVCLKCGLVYADSDGLWVCCDGCNQWFDLNCTNITGRKVP